MVKLFWFHHLSNRGNSSLGKRNERFWFGNDKGRFGRWKSAYIILLTMKEVISGWLGNKEIQTSQRVNRARMLRKSQQKQNFICFIFVNDFILRLEGIYWKIPRLLIFRLSVEPWIPYNVICDVDFTKWFCLLLGLQFCDTYRLQFCIGSGRTSSILLSKYV